MINEEEPVILRRIIGKRVKVPYGPAAVRAEPVFRAMPASVALSATG